MYKDRQQVEDAVRSSRTPQELDSAYRTAYGLGQRTPRENVKFGVQASGSKAAIDKARRQANQAALDILDRPGVTPESLSEEDKAALRAYTGEGGIGESTHEYYTPQHVAEGAWDALEAMGLTAGNILEPSAGAGVFHGTKPDGMVMTATEIDQTSAAINQLLHPEDEIQASNFEKLAAGSPDDHFDGVVGNVPFGSTRGGFGDDDPEYAHIRYVDQYFVTRTIDKVKPGGLIALVVPPRIIDRADDKGKWEKWRKSISLKAEFLGAHRMPTGTFDESGTDTVTDLLIMQKHSEELAEQIAAADQATLERANVLWAPFIEGRWFKTDGRRFIMGEMTTEGSGQFERMRVKGIKITNAGMRQRLAQRFESRINTDELNVAPTKVLTYAAGDRALINGRWREMGLDGQWKEVSFTRADGSLDPETYGATSPDGIRQLLADQPSNPNLTFEQMLAIKRDFPSLLDETHLSGCLSFAQDAPEGMQERVYRGMVIGHQIQELLNIIEHGGLHDELRQQIADQVNDQVKRYGVALGDGQLRKLTGPGANAWQAFLQSTDRGGNLSALLTGSLERGGVTAFDSTDLDATVRHLFNAKDLQPVSLDDLRQWYTGDAPLSLEHFATLPGVAITADGMLEPMDRFLTGHVTQKARETLKAAQDESNPAIRAKLERQANDLFATRKAVDPERIKFRLTDKYINRQLVVQFLATKSLSLQYGVTELDEDGNEYHNTKATGGNGLFTGYRTFDPKTGEYKHKSNSNNSLATFGSHLEGYLNGVNVNAGTRENTALTKERIRDLEADFDTWLRMHDEFENVVEDYHETFHGYIPPQHSGAPLGLENLKDGFSLFDYQNSAVRQLSEDGTGILGFGTGLGKTAAGYALAENNKQLGRAKRTLIVVPKSVSEKWYHDAVKQLKSLNGYLFTSWEPVLEGGKPKLVPVLDEQGKHKRNKHTGELEYQHQVREITGAEVWERINSIPQSNYSVVVMTKDQLARIPMKADSKERFVEDWVDRKMMSKNSANSTMAGKSNYKAAKAKEQARDQIKDTRKKNGVPYFEDLGFDNVICDEFHNYRNSFNAGYEASQLANLPTINTSLMAMDMATKAEYIRSRNGGRGVVGLTATPTVNSPLDIFNMLSLTTGLGDFTSMGVHTPDDFVRVFGLRETVQVQTLSGAVETTEGLVGFDNLDALRQLYHRRVIALEAKDVSESVKIPDLEEHNINVEMSEEQAELYEQLRQRADDLHEGRESAKGDAVFSIIRDMDRVCTDLDLYNKVITFLAPESRLEALQAIVNELPDSITLKRKRPGEKKAETIEVAHEATITTAGNAAKLVVHELFEDLVRERLAASEIPGTEISHPMVPKCAALIENAREELAAGGKQIIFTEEKSQHKKLATLLAHHLDVDPSEIGIINADTAGAKKARKKGKGLEMDLDQSVDLDAELAGLEVISNAYNSGKLKFLICNKKAEVGLDLHIGTTAIHHLTLPWTPSSIKQRNGRGARVGSTQDKVNVHYYLGKGSFDAFRLRALQAKAGWQQELFKGDSATAENADSDDKADYSLMLAADPEELKARQERAKKQAEERLRAAARKRATIDINNYLKAAHRAATDPAELERKLEDISTQIMEDEKLADQARQNVEKAYGFSMRAQAREDLERIQNRIKSNRGQTAKVLRQQELAKKARQQMAMAEGGVEQAIKQGLVPEDFLTHAHQMLVDKEGRVYRLGEQYEWKEFKSHGRNHSESWTMVGRVESINQESNSLTLEILMTTRSGHWKERVGDTTTKILNGQTLKRTSYTIGELAITKALTKEYERHELVSHDVITAEVWAANQDKLQVKSGSTVLRKPSGEYYIGFFQKNSDSYAGMDQLPYLDRKDKRQMAEVARAFLAAIKGEAYFQPYSHKDLLKALYGADYMEAVEQFGHVAGAEILEQYRALLQSQAEKAEEYREAWAGITAEEGAWSQGYNLQKLLRKLAKAGKADEIRQQYDNQTQFDKVADAWIKQEGERLEAAVKQLQAEQRKREQAERAAREAEERRLAEIANREREAQLEEYRQDTPENRDARVKWLRDYAEANQDKRFGMLSWFYDRTGNLAEGCPYVVNGDVDTDLAKIDLELAGYLEKREAMTPASFKTDEPASLTQLLATVYYDVQRGNAGDKPSGEITGDATLTALSAATGIVFKSNAEPVFVRRMGNREPFTTLAMHDPAGKNGALFRAKDELKATFRAKYGKNVSDEFTGSWWFIKADADRQQLDRILRNNA